MWDWSQEILGEPASKSNQRRLVQIGGKPRFIKSKKALDYGQNFSQQVKPPSEPLSGDLEVGVVIWYASRRPDLDPSLIFDLLQKTEVIKNDRQIKVIHAYHALDRDNPRCRIQLRILCDECGQPYWSVL
jgi:Holliday junction resolvase RusA-like endonuclease